MGCNSSKASDAAPPGPSSSDQRREKQAQKRKKSQDKLRPTDQDEQVKLESNFESEVSNWPSRPPWYKKGKQTQGINILIAAPEPLREMYIQVVERNNEKYSVCIGYGKETKYDSANKRFSIACSTVSTNHATLHFSRSNGKSVVSIEDTNSLNGTFVLGRPPPHSTRRPVLEKEVRKETLNLESIEYIRLGSACVLALDATSIFWDDDDDDDEDEQVADATEDCVPHMLENGWYFPMPCPPKLAEITQKKREVVDDPSLRQGGGVKV